ncbi:hypothetical protein [Spiroplasma ixodetis]|uniref:Transposase n=1 Tax=Spiroplasma ixodetis TaxID=2141 RepID=A0ABN6SZX9_9MOLU|nr:hypothetical protein [Spiroplasma ixodetis]BDT04696.1 hypothetical protein SHM_23420 [Spiroplasma ixodetis]
MNSFSFIIPSTSTCGEKSVKQFTNSGSFKIKNNLSDLEKQLIQANKELKQLRMENDILKQAALIIGRK